MSDEVAFISLTDVSKVFHTDELETHALSGITMRVDRGEFVAITGPSGCGKSTLLSVLGLLDSHDGGDYRVAGEEVSALSPSARARVRNRQVGFIFQSFNLIADLTVAENVLLPLTYRDDHNRRRARQRVEEVLEMVGMAHRTRHYPGQLSGGQQQRVAVARALAGDPLLLLADEPTGNLDSHNGEMIIQLLETLHQGGSTICMVTHDTAHARRAGRVIHMLDGRIVDEDLGQRGSDGLTKRDATDLEFA